MAGLVFPLIKSHKKGHDCVTFLYYKRGLGLCSATHCHCGKSLSSPNSCQTGMKSAEQTSCITLIAEEQTDS